MPSNLVFLETEDTDFYSIFNGIDKIGILILDRNDKRKSKVQFESGFDGNRQIAEKRLIDLYIAYEMASSMAA